MKKNLLKICMTGYLLISTAHVSAETNPDSEIDMSTIITTVILNEILNNVDENLNAASSENNIFDKFIRGSTGVSIKDIKEYGLCGGSNSEFRKLFGSLC